MKIRKWIVVLAITLIAGGLGASQGLAYMRANYGGACSELSGLPGLMQSMNLLALGSCEVKKNGNCDDNKHICSISSASGRRTGVCRHRPHVGCQCVVD